ATWPFRMSSSMSESSALCQSTASVVRPCAFTESRASANRSSKTSYSGPMSPARRSRNQRANAGLRPEVPTVMARSPRRSTEGSGYGNAATASRQLRRHDPGAALLVEGQDLELDRQVDLAERHSRRHRDDGGGEVEDRRDAGAHEAVGHVLRGARGRGDDA